MRNILALILIIVSINSFGQNPANYQYRVVYERLRGLMPDSVIHIPRYNGVPSGLRGGSSNHDGAIAMDTLNGNFYIYHNTVWIRMAKFSELTPGYTTLSQFVDETAWRTFYSNGSGDVTPLAFGTSGKVLTSNGVSAAPTWETVTASTQTLQQVFDTEVGGSVLTKIDTIQASTFGLRIFGTSGTKLSVNATSGVAVEAGATSGTGLAAYSGSGYGAIINSDGKAALIYTGASGAGVQKIAEFGRIGGTPAVGYGGGIDFQLWSSTFASRVANSINSKWVTHTDASRESELDIMGLDNTATETFMNIQNDLVRINNNADTLSTMAYARSVGGGGGDVSKVGTPVNNQVGVWTGDGTIEGDADFTFDGSAITGRWKARVGSTTSSATPTINTDNVDVYELTAQAANITSFTTNLSGTPNNKDILEIVITDDGTPRTIAWGASFVSTTTILPTTTTASTTLTIILQYYSTSSYGNGKWHCVSYY